MVTTDLPLVRSDTFVRATRDAGYRNAATAIAELVDNAVQASARSTQVIVTHTVSDDDLCVVVADDGSGMEADTMSLALQFGGSSHFDDRRGTGRFGMGLPNASLSQARRVDVYSRRSNGPMLHAFLDVDLVASGLHTGPVGPQSTTPPEWLSPLVRAHGTVVVWTKCDRLHRRRLSALESHLHADLGRVFRNAIRSGLRLSINGAAVAIVDPILIIPRPATAGEVEVLPPLDFEFAAPALANERAQVTVRFALLPVEQWTYLSTEDKRRLGITKGAGVSILRHGREIAYGWYLLGTKRRENYDDWWRCEISFDPALDELFGVTHSKQGIRPTSALADALVPSLEAQAHRLNAEIRRRFSRITRRSSAVARAELLHPAIPDVVTPVQVNVPGHRRVEGVRYQLAFAPSRGRRFYSAQRDDTEVRVTVNTNHPFYERLYHPLAERVPADLRSAVDCLILSLAKAEVSGKMERYENVLTGFCELWSDTMAAFLDG